MFRLKLKIRKNQRRKSLRRSTITPAIEFQVITWGSSAYIASLDLRNQSLNIPSQLPLLTAPPLEERTALHIVAKANGTVIGTLFLAATKVETVAQIKQVAVSSDYRGQKIGQSLMTFAEHIAAEVGYEELILHARESAWLFYEKLGYHADGIVYHNGANQMQPYRKALHSHLPNAYSEVVA